MRTVHRFALLSLFAACLAAPLVAHADGAPAPAPAVQVDAGAEGGIATSPNAVTPAPDPTADLSGTVKAVTAAREHAGYIGAAVLVLYILGAFTIRMSGHVGWFAQGRRLAIVTGVVGVVGALSDHFLKAADWQTVAAAAWSAIGIYLVPLHPNAADGSATAGGVPTGIPPSK
jgi:hypothetical protein